MTATRLETLARFGVTVEPDLERLPPPELFPTRPAYVVREHDGARVLDAMTWGFPPPIAARAPVTNVRNLDSPFWRSALQRPDRRCLVPATDFCEWEGDKGAKVARWFSCNGRPIFAFAGVWRPTEDGGAFAFLTCDPNPLVAPIHPKAMPVVLHEEDEARWLQGDWHDVRDLAAPHPSQLMSVS